jgi:hypothetical protein
LISIGSKDKSIFQWEYSHEQIDERGWSNVKLDIQYQIDLPTEEPVHIKEKSKGAEEKRKKLVVEILESQPNSLSEIKDTVFSLLKLER